MSDLKIKEISNYMDNNIRKTKLVISDNNKEAVITFEGKGNLKVAVKS